MENAEKVIALYRYIKELCALKYRVITDVDKQYWTLYLNNIPDDPDCISIFYRDRVDEDSDSDSILLSVKKPDFQRCPDPFASFEEWLEPGWDRYTNAVKLKVTLSDAISGDIDDENQTPEHFNDSERRVKAFEQWIAQRNIWVEKQLIIFKTRRFFTRLFEIYTDLERESETLELMVGNGIIRDKDNNSVNHPILLKRVKFQFDAKANIISIHDADAEPELYTLLLQDMREINHSIIKQMNDDLHENFYHPLDRNDSPDFLKVLTHRLCSDSRFIADKDDKISSGDRLITTLNPVYFVRKRIDGTLKAIEEIISNIENTGYIPGHLLNLIDGGIVEVPEDNQEPTIEEQLAALSGESLPILLSKEANREQLEIAERIEHYNAVLVQGPPGTGKTHTIANLLGHFLAQGKSVLVTSHTKKALAVLKEKVPDEIKDLCVSALDDTNLDMVRSVDGITEYTSRHTVNELKKQVESDTRQRAEIIKQLAEIRKKIYAIKYREFEPIVYNGDSYSPSQAAAFVNANANTLSYIPGKVKLYHPLPVTVEQMIQLYRSNAGLSEEEEQELTCDIPSPDNVLHPSIFEENLKQYSKCDSAILKISNELNLNVDIQLKNNALFVNGDMGSIPLIQNPVSENLERLSQFANTFNSFSGWMIHAAVDGHKGGGYLKRWQMLTDAIEDTVSCADSIVTHILGRTIEIRSEVDTNQLPTHLQKIEELFQSKGKITRLNLLFNKSLQEVLDGIRINGVPIASEDDCRLVQHFLTLQKSRKYTATLWNELMAKHGAPEFYSLGDEPEHIGARMAPNIKRYLGWYQNEYNELLESVRLAGLNADTIFCESELDSDLVHTEKILSAAHKFLPQYISLANYIITLCETENRKKQAIQLLSEGKRQRSSVCASLVRAITDSQPEAYRQNYQQLSAVYSKYELRASRESILAAIEPIAPEWADAIQNRVGIHGDAICPESIEDAWKWKQFAGIIESITAMPFEVLQHRAVMFANELRQMTAKVAANSAWYRLMLRTERDLSMRQALQGWKLTIKKIGKGTGKNVPTLKKQAKELMAKCQTAVPAWIMPVNKAMETLDPARNSFDVIIIDEASQSDISALGILYMAKKVIVVGDDKQVSPMAVGVDIDKMNALRDMYIKDIIPNWQLYTSNTSLYDIAGTIFQPLMLREHFRCLPDIIGYSNKLSYDYKIKPLREAGSSRIYPPVVNFRVDDGKREGSQKTNIKEAKTIVALMISCMEQTEYEGMTFGIISLLGDEQALKIQQIILQKIDPTVIEHRHILCGNASHFQGDARDVVFLSLVDSNEGEGPLRMAGEGANQSQKQRYNVAASRAKDQLWVVHSLDYTRDLKNGDLRRDLLEYANNPKAFAQLAEKVKEKAESPFEEAVGKALVCAGYHIVQQWNVGAYRIDMVVLCGGKRVAVECDGEAFHSGDEQVRKDMERQAILVRIGWRFIRIRGSEYYRDPDKTMEKVKQELSEYGILPETVMDESAEQTESALLERVKIRATQILDEWHIESDDTVSDAQYEPVTDMIPPKPPTSKEAEISKFEQLTLGSFPSPEKFQTQRQKKKELFVHERKSTSFVKKDNPKLNSVQIKPQSSSKGFSLINSLSAADISYLDNRAQSGIIWVLFSGEYKSQIEKIISNCGLRYSFEGRGSKATGNRPAWRIMSD
jgi:superfamily I DNA and/or RNA helicase